MANSRAMPIRQSTYFCTATAVMCHAIDAEGICVKLPTTVETEDGETIQALTDTVFALKDGALHGTEPVATLEWIDGAMLLNMMES